MDYSKLFEVSAKELETIRVQKAQVQNKLQELAQELGIDLNGDVEKQIAELSASLKKDQSTLELTLQDIDKQLKELENVQ